MPYSNVNTWIFDLDNTLYPSSTGLLNQINDRITSFVAEKYKVSHDEAFSIRKNNHGNFGTTLSALAAEGEICHHTYFNYIFGELDYSVISPCNETKSFIEKLPGRKVIYTNGEKSYAKRVLKKLNMHDIFEEVYDVTWADLQSKPQKSPYEKLLQELNVAGTECLMVEDSAMNLKPAKELGMKTVLIHHDKIKYDFVDEQAEDVLSWLVNINKKIN